MQAKPLWPFLIAILLGLTQPAVHLYLEHCAPEGAVHSGLSIPDSAIFLASMQVFENGFYSAYASCHAPDGGQGFYYYALPHLLLYGVVGGLANLLHLPHFLFLGIANGLGLTFYLLMCWRFLRAAAPALAPMAYALFTLSAGPGGILYLLALAIGLHHTPGFDDWAFRWIAYDVTEGPFFNPLLIGPRLYYTLSLGVLMGAMAALAAGNWRHLLCWLPFLLLASFIYARAGVFSTAIAAIVLWHTPGRRMILLLPYAAATGMGVAASTTVMRINPTVMQNHLLFASQAMWISPALIALSLHLPAIATGLRRSLPALPAWQRRLLHGAMGYIAAYALLYVLRSIYFGTLWLGRDGAVAAAISDYALVGILPGVLWPLRSHEAGSHSLAPPWAAAWALLIFALAICGAGGGWMLQFGPQRLQLFLWLPLCVLAAAGFAAWEPSRRAAALAIVFVAGAASVATGLVFFQAGAGRSNAQGPFLKLHAEWISTGDAEAIASLKGKTVLALPPIADAAVQIGKAKSPFGTASFNLSDRPFHHVQQERDDYFSSGTSNEIRRSIELEWCAQAVLLTPTTPEAIGIKQLMDTRGLRREEFPGGSTLYWLPEE